MWNCRSAFIVNNKGAWGENETIMKNKIKIKNDKIMTTIMTRLPEPETRSCLVGARSNADRLAVRTSKFPHSPPILTAAKARAPRLETFPWSGNFYERSRVPWLTICGTDRVVHQLLISDTTEFSNVFIMLTSILNNAIFFFLNICTNHSFYV